MALAIFRACVRVNKPVGGILGLVNLKTLALRVPGSQL